MREQESDFVHGFKKGLSKRVSELSDDDWQAPSGKENARRILLEPDFRKLVS